MEVGEAAVLLDGQRTTVRSLESNLANYITDTVLAISCAEMAFINGGCVRESIQKGKVKVIDILNVLPFNNTIIAMLKKSASLGRDAVGLLHFSKGLKNKIIGNVLESHSYLGKPIYRVATSSFLAVGGDGYKEFKTGKRVYDTGITMGDAVQKRIMADRIANPTVDGRLQRD